MNSFVHTIKFKIVLAFGVCVVLMVALGLFGVFGVSTLNSNANILYSGGTMVLSDFITIEGNQVDIPLQLRRIQVVRDPAATQTALAAIQDDRARLDKAWSDYYPAYVSDGEDRQFADTIKDNLPEFHSLVDQAVAAFQAGDYDAGGVAVNKLGKVDPILSDSIRKVVDINRAHAKDLADSGNATFHSIRTIAIALVCAGLLVAIAMTVYLLRAITRPLHTAVEVADRIAAGNLANRLEITSRDEFGQLLGALKKMDQQLTDAVRQIVGATDSVSTAAKEIAGGDIDLSARTEEQAASLEQTAASMNELTHTVQQNADSARQANSLATSATGLVNSGNETVQGMVRTIGEISSSSDKISDITGLIEGIAFQTNILALNAAVEAARAGEQGRGFAVVATEVRTLAQRSASAAKEIKELIGSSVAMIQGGVKQAAGVSETMDQIQLAIKQVADIVAEITAASDEQSKGIEQINKAVSQMDDVTQQNAALVEETAAAAQSLDEQAMKLKNIVAVFKIAGAGFERPAIAAQRSNVQH